MSVEIVEVGHDDWHGQSYGEHTRYDAQGTHQFAPHSNRCHVAVPHRRHGYNGPPERAWDRRELRLLFASLSVVGRRAEDHHGDDEEEKEHAEFVHAGLDGEAEDSKALWVFRQLEDAEHSQHADEHERAALLGRLAVAVSMLDDEDDEERNDCDDVEDVHDAEAEVALGRTRDEAKDELDGEPGHADGLHDEKRIVVVRSKWRRQGSGRSTGSGLRAARVVGERNRLRLVRRRRRRTRCWRGDVDADWTIEARQSLHAKVHHLQHAMAAQLSK